MPEDLIFEARDSANTVISLTSDGELMRGDQHINDMPPEELRQIIKKLVDLLLNMHNPNAL